MSSINAKYERSICVISHESITKKTIIFLLLDATENFVPQFERKVIGEQEFA